MPAHGSGFERFLRLVHRRFVALRVLERTGLGILAGCSAGLPLVVVAAWRGVATGSLAVGALALGGVGGVLAGILQRPTLHDAATEADRQLETSDLLSTALNMHGNPDPWAGAVIASADQWSRGVSPSSVILNRLGARAWGGIGLATALLGVLTLLPTYATPIQAADHSSSPSIAGLRDQPFASTANSRRTAPEQIPEDLRTHSNLPDESTSRPSGSSESRTDNGRQSGGRDAGGRGESHTASGSQNFLNSPEATQARDSSPRGRGADGAGRGAQNTARGNSGASQTSGSDSALLLTPWKSSQWSQQAQQALHAVDSGQVPDAYRDVIHDYFDHR